MEFLQSKWQNESDSSKYKCIHKPLVPNNWCNVTKWPSNYFIERANFIILCFSFFLFLKILANLFKNSIRNTFNLKWVFLIYFHHFNHCYFGLINIKFIDKFNFHYFFFRQLKSRTFKKKEITY